MIGYDESPTPPKCPDDAAAKARFASSGVAGTPRIAWANKMQAEFRLFSPGVASATIDDVAAGVALAESADETRTAGGIAVGEGGSSEGIEKARKKTGRRTKDVKAGPKAVPI